MRFRPTCVRSGTLALVLAVLVAGAWASVAAAAPGIQSTRDANQVASAITSPSLDLLGATFLSLPPGDGGSVTTPASWVETAPGPIHGPALAGFPTNGTSYAILTTGNPQLADDANSSGSSGANVQGPNVRGNSDLDVTILRLSVNVHAGQNCLAFDYRFMSEEFPEFVGSSVNDAFIAERDTSNWTTNSSVITRPNDFASGPAVPISVNGVGPTAVTAAQAAGTTYDASTNLLTGRTPVTPGNHTVFLSIFDQGDHIYDSAIFVDNLRTAIGSAGSCKAPVFNKSADVIPKSGTVKVKQPGSKTFVTLKNGVQVPIGSVVDARKGRVTVTTADASGKTQSADFYEGIFKILQTTDKPAITELVLQGGNFKKCKASKRKRGRRAESAKRRKSKKKVRHLWGNGKGRFRTRGKHSSATVRGTIWLTEDRCDGTLTKVKRGSVTVDDFRKKKDIVVRQGKSYLAK